MDLGLPGTSSAIAALLHSLTSPPPQVPPNGTGPTPPPGPMATPALPPGPGAVAPTVAPPQGPQHHGIAGAVLSLLSHFDPRPKAPAGYQGLLSPEEIQQARPGILQSLIGSPDAPSSEDRYRSNLDHVLQLHGVATQIAEQRRILDNRRAIEAKYPLPPNPTMDEIRNNLAQRYDAYIGAGDTEMAKEIGSSLRGIMTAPKAETSKLLQPGDILVNPSTGTPIAANPSQGKEQTPQLFVGKDGNSIWVRPGESIPPGAKPWSAEIATARINAQASQAASKDAEGYSRAFQAQIKPLRDRAGVIDQAIKTIGDAADERDPAKQRALYSSAIANFIQAADQKAQIRWQLLNYYKENIDPSVAGKWNVLRERLLKGTLPQYTMQALLSHLQGLRTMVYNEIETQRQGWAKRKPDAADMLPPTSEFFPQTGGVEVPSSAKGGDLYSKYGLTPKR